MSSQFSLTMTDLATEIIKGSWDIIKDSTKLTYSDFINAIQFCLHNAYIKLKEKIYKHKFRSPMSYTISAFAADTVTNDIEYKVLENKKLKSNNIIYYGHVDDTIVTIKNIKVY